MATEITLSPLVDGVLTLARVEQLDDDDGVSVEEYALERDVAAEVEAALAAPGDDPPELTRRQVAGRIRRVGWLHLPNAA